ncbi:TRAP transporter large permease [Deferribacter abyssi]|uniref:TRAP transporter large permease n=1 Tax=Deferribacter abyssi TaxID=213806 RepID=UPI003C212639
MENTLLFILLFLLLFLNVPVAVSLGLSVFTIIFFFADLDIAYFSQQIFNGINHFTLAAIPLFVLTGNVLSKGGAADRIIRFAKAVVGHFPGGLPMSAIFACTIFAAVSGSSPATVAAIGSIMFGAIQEAGYSPKFSVGSIVSAGSLGILIPPSIVLIVYGVTAEQSIGDLFLAGFIPGAILGTMLMLVTYIMARREGFKRVKRASFSEVATSFKNAFPGLFTIVIIIGGIYGGIFTPTEAAAVSAVYAFFVSVFVYRDIELKDIINVTSESVITSTMILFIIANAMLFANFITIMQIPQSLAQWIVDMNFSKVVFLIFINILLLIGGNFMEPSGLIMIIVPLILPAAMKLGIDPIQLGIIVTVNMEIGMLTPPVGLNLFVASSISGMNIFEVFKHSLPYFIVLIIFLLMVTYIPQISLIILGR